MPLILAICSLLLAGAAVAVAARVRAARNRQRRDRIVELLAAHPKGLHTLPIADKLIRPMDEQLFTDLDALEEQGRIVCLRTSLALGYGVRARPRYLLAAAARDGHAAPEAVSR